MQFPKKEDGDVSFKKHKKMIVKTYFVIMCVVCSDINGD